MMRRRRAARLFVPAGALGVLLLLAVLAPFLPLVDPNAGEVKDRLQPLWSTGHVLGTDGQGRDVLSRMVWGSRPALVAGVVPVLVAAVVGTTLGVAAGLHQGWIRTVIMRTLDVFYAFPAVLLAIAIAASLGAGLASVVLSLAVVLVPPITRVIETEVVRIRAQDFMLAARASGAGWGLIARRQVLPAIAPTIIVYCSSLVGLAIVLGAGLGFLGLGVAPPQADWGSMLEEFRRYLFTSPNLTMIPALAIFATSVACNLLGDRLRERFQIQGGPLA